MRTAWLIAIIIVATLVLRFIFGLDFVAGVACGFLANILVGLWFSWDQFSCSTTGYRIKNTAEATQKIVSQGAGCSRERNRYRYSLGVIIDELEQTFGREGNFEDKEWPCLVDYDSERHQLPKDGKGNDIDRWKRFDERVRPVVDDINSSAFIGNYSWIRRLSKDIRQLYALTKLCSQLESVVSELDAAFEAKSLMKLNDKNHVVLQKVVNPTASESESVERLRGEYRALFAAWREWLHTVGIQCKTA